MANPTAVVFALTMAVWVADVRLAPKHAEPTPVRAPVAACESGISASAPAGVDLEVVTCGTRLGK